MNTGTSVAYRPAYGFTNLLNRAGENARQIRALARVFVLNLTLIRRRNGRTFFAVFRSPKMFFFKVHTESRGLLVRK